LLKFQLPYFDVVSQALLVAKVKDVGIVETFSKTIPIAFNQILVCLLFPLLSSSLLRCKIYILQISPILEFYFADKLFDRRELVEEVPNVVYFQAAFPKKILFSSLPTLISLSSLTLSSSLLRCKKFIMQISDF
jgi:hypothetical protein